MMATNGGLRAKHWCFTMNNYTDQDVQRLSNPLPGVEYLVFGREVGASGTRHLQGYVCFQSRKRLSQCIAIIGQAHFTVTRFVLQSIEYCKKDGDFIEVGTAPSAEDINRGRGKRNDLEDFKNSVKEGETNIQVLTELHSSVVARFPKFVEKYTSLYKPQVSVPAFPLRQWQADLNNRLLLPPHPREIIFVVDAVGNQGKSWFCRYYEGLHPENTQIIIPGKKADMAYTVREDVRVFFMDCPRSKQGEFIQYDFLEELKNGYVFSPKYESKVKKFETPHVVVVMNEQPAMDKLSMDRYSITTLV